MDKDNILLEMLYNVSDEIGTDISYISTNENDYQYLTGMDFGMILAAGIASTFFVPLISGFANKIGEELAQTVIERLKRTSANSQKQLKERNVDNKIVIEFIKIVPDSVFSSAHSPSSMQDQEAIKTIQIAAIQNYLEASNFPQDKARLQAEKIYDILSETIEDA